MNKDDMLKQLRENKIMKHVLSMAKDDEERRRIKAHAEGFALHFYKQVYEPVAAAQKKDPEVVIKTLKDFQQSLINSGSNDSGGK